MDITYFKCFAFQQASYTLRLSENAYKNVIPFILGWKLGTENYGLYVPIFNALHNDRHLIRYVLAETLINVTCLDTWVEADENY